MEDFDSHSHTTGSHILASDLQMVKACEGLRRLEEPCERRKRFFGNSKIFYMPQITPLCEVARVTSDLRLQEVPQFVLGEFLRLEEPSFEENLSCCYWETL